MTSYKVSEDLEINVPCSLSFQICLAVLWSLLCASFTTHKWWTLCSFIFCLRVTAIDRVLLCDLQQNT